jgi:hypothetical protein
MVAFVTALLYGSRQYGIAVKLIQDQYILVAAAGLVREVTSRICVDLTSLDQ